jgi:hypothetical protein
MEMGSEFQTFNKLFKPFTIRPNPRDFVDFLIIKRNVSKKIIKRNKTVKKEYVCACIEYDKLMDVEKYELIIT